METGTLRSWSKKEGEKIAEGINHHYFNQFFLILSSSIIENLIQE
jgi:hypothetical protein